MKRWQDSCIKHVTDFKVPGLYFLKARTFGTKGALGGTHSWLTHVGEKQHVFEVTDYETVALQGFSMIQTYRNVVMRNQMQVMCTDRDGGQRWFGHDPEVSYLGVCELSNLEDWTKLYPCINERFRMVTTNCNTYTSWIMHLLGIDLWTGIGARA